MRKLFFILLSFSLGSCQTQKTNSIQSPKNIYADFLDFNTYFVTRGSILIYDLNKNSYYSNDFEWAKKGRIPASTFKIPHSLIALELGIVEDENTVFKWDGEPRNFEIWQQDMSFKQAFHYSCVPCYQEIARKITAKRMNKFIDKYNYGTLVFDKENIDEFWLVGESKINQFEQINFLRRLYHSQLPITKRTESIFKQMFIVESNINYILRGKTGLSVNEEKYNGWYVGYVEANNNVYFFATNMSPVNKYDDTFNAKRKSYTIKALQQLGILP